MSPPQAHRTELDTRAGAFNAFETFGGQLLTQGHFATPEVQEKLDSIRQDRKAVEK